MVDKVFGAAGDELVVEQLLIGEEYFALFQSCSDMRIIWGVETCGDSNASL